VVREVKGPADYFMRGENAAIGRTAEWSAHENALRRAAVVPWAAGGNAGTGRKA